MNPERAVRAREIGQSLWYDNISRELLRSGELARLIEEGLITGITTNPTIFQKALAGSDAYEAAIDEGVRDGLDVDAIYHRLTLADVREAADLLRPVWERSGGEDGYVSLEVLPSLAHDRASTVAEAVRLHNELDRPNTMIKVPGTPDGVEAFRQLTAQGIPVNVTLLFSMSQYEAIAQAWVQGLSERHAAGGDLRGVASVASFFVSRVDGKVDGMLEKLSGGAELIGKTGIANCRQAYRRFREIFSGAAFRELAQAGARVQRVLWASTSTKNPAFPDTLYVDELLGADTVNTLPPATLEAFLDHGVVEAGAIERDLAGADAHMERLQKQGIDLDAVCEQLQSDGVASFEKSFEELMASLAQKVASRRQSAG